MPREGAALRTGEDGAVQSAGLRVFRELKNAIITMSLAPGQALSENEIAVRLGVSRQPVREAFIKLGEAGLVRIRPQRGTFVVKISAQQVADAHFVREAVEVAVVRRACEVMTAASLTGLKRIIGAQRVAAIDSAPARFLALDEAFHLGLALGVGHENAWHAVEKTKPQMDRVRCLNHPQSTLISPLIDQHVVILGAIEDRDPDAAEAAMRAHLAEVISSLPFLEETYPHLFEGPDEIEAVGAAKAKEAAGN